MNPWPTTTSAFRELLILDAVATRAALPMEAAIEAMRVGLGDDRETPLRSLLGGSLFMPGRAAGNTGVKVVSIVPGRPSGLVLILDPDGVPMGIVDGPTLTSIRTGAAAGLATALLAEPTASTMAMLGAGAMALDQVGAVAAVRRLVEVRVWSRDQERARTLVDQLTLTGSESSGCGESGPGNRRCRSHLHRHSITCALVLRPGSRRGRSYQCGRCVHPGDGRDSARNGRTRLCRDR